MRRPGGRAAPEATAADDAAADADDDDDNDASGAGDSDGSTWGTGGGGDGSGWEAHEGWEAQPGRNAGDGGAPLRRGATGSVPFTTVEAARLECLERCCGGFVVFKVPDAPPQRSVVLHF